MKYTKASWRLPLESNRRGLTRADVVTTLLVLGILLIPLFVVVGPAFLKARIKDMQSRCARNLSAIGAAVSQYANDYEYMPPIAGGLGTVWGPGLKDWTAEKRIEAFGLAPDGTGGQASISSSLYMLVRHADLGLESFVCPMEKKTSVFDPHKCGAAGRRSFDLWDFGPDPARHCSYAYHMVYAQFHPQTPRRLVLALAADRNPWIDSPFGKAQDFSLFKPDQSPFTGTVDGAVRGNSAAHYARGQNILYLDGHVESTMRSYHTVSGYQMRSSDEHHQLRSITDDNIYTAWDGDDRVRGLLPVPYQAQPASEFDSLLVNDPPLKR